MVLGFIKNHKVCWRLKASPIKLVASHLFLPSVVKQENYNKTLPYYVLNLQE